MSNTLSLKIGMVSCLGNLAVRLFWGDHEFTSFSMNFFFV